MTKKEHTPSLNRAPNKRKLIYIDRTFQLHTLVYFNGLVFLIIGLLFASLFSIISDFSQELANPEQSLKLIRRTYALFGVTALITLIATNLVGLLFTHRISGPLVRLRSFLNRAATTNELSSLSPIKFRENDFFQELPELVNQAFKLNGKKDQK